MKIISYCFLMNVVYLSLYGCCVRFSDLTPESTYKVGDVINTSHINILVEKFQWGNGVWTTTGTAKVDTKSWSGGSGIDINARNVNLNIKIKYPVKMLSLKFGELGGNVNVTINNNLINIGDLIELNRTTIEGVKINVVAEKKGSNWFGKITLDGAITSFSIGGQEFWIDDFCVNKCNF